MLRQSADFGIDCLVDTEPWHISRRTESAEVTKEIRTATGFSEDPGCRSTPSQQPPRAGLDFRCQR